MATAGKRKRTILSVEDDPHASRLIRAILEAAGHTVFTESTSQGAMKALAQIQPSIILLDVNLGEESGYDLCQHIKASYPDRDTLFVFLTGNKTPEDVAMARQLGADYFIIKPFTPESLLGGLDRAFVGRRIKHAGR